MAGLLGGPALYKQYSYYKAEMIVIESNTTHIVVELKNSSN